MIQENKIPWLKDVNTTWQCFQVKRGFETVLGKMLQPTQRNSDDIEVPYLKALHIHWDGIKFEDLPKMWANQSEIEQLSLKQGDLIVCEGGEVGRGTMLNHQLPSNCIIQNSLHRVRNKELGETRFLRYILQSASDIGWLDVLCNRATIRHFTVEKFSEFWIAVPSKKEQKLIADYLDRETTQIDNLIAAKEQMLTLLEEKREALISHAVTRGLDPNVSFKRSGLDWLGDIPKHWNIQKVKHSFEIVLGKMLEPTQRTNNDIEVPYLKALHIHWDGVIFQYLLNMWANQTEIRHLKLKQGDLLVCEGGEVGRATILNIELPPNTIIQNSLHRVRSKESGENRFLRYLLRHASTKGVIDVLCNRATIGHFTVEKFREFLFALPPKNEQILIADYLDYETSKIDELLSAIKESIALLKERRSALITAAVTGQIALEEMTS